MGNEHQLHLDEPPPVVVEVVVSPVEVLVAVLVHVREVDIAIRIDPGGMYLAPSRPLLLVHWLTDLELYLIWNLDRLCCRIHEC